MKLTKPTGLIFLTLLVPFVQAQDIILTKKAKEKKVNILESDSTHILLKNYHQPKWDKRVFSFNLHKGLAVKYAVGTCADMHNHIITSSEFDYIKYNTLTRRFMRKGIIALSCGGTFLGVGVCMLGYGLNALRESKKNPEWQTDGAYNIMIGGVAAIPAIPLCLIGSMLTKKAIEYRNKRNQLWPSVGFNAIINLTGQAMKTGMAINITF